MFGRKKPLMEMKDRTVRIRWPYKQLHDTALDATAWILADWRTSYDKNIFLRKFDKELPEISEGWQEAMSKENTPENILKRLACLYRLIVDPKENPSYKPYALDGERIFEVPLFNEGYGIPGRYPDVSAGVYIWPRPSHPFEIKDNPFDRYYHPKREIIIPDKEKFKPEAIEKKLTYNLSEGRLECVLGFYSYEGKEKILTQKILSRAKNLSQSLCTILDGIYHW